MEGGRMEIRHLQHFVALAREGQFHLRRAQSKYCSIVAVKLDQRTGRRTGSVLVERTTREVAITETGMLFLQHARATLASLEGAVQAVRSRDGVVRGQLRLGI